MNEQEIKFMQELAELCGKINMPIQQHLYIQNGIKHIISKLVPPPDVPKKDENLKKGKGKLSPVPTPSEPAKNNQSGELA